MNAVAYPRLLRRVRATLVDSLLLTLVAFGALFLAASAGLAHPLGKALLILLPILMLEPGLVALTGGTVGHHLVRLRVTRLDGVRNITFPAATVRFLVKLLFGTLSLIFVLTTSRHQALHDLVARSMVIHKAPQALPAYEVLAERHHDRANYHYPSGWRRVAVVMVYALLATIALSLTVAAAVTDACLERQQCTPVDTLLDGAASLAWLFALAWLAIRGWSGRLFGCRRRPRGVAE